MRVASRGGISGKIHQSLGGVNNGKQSQIAQSQIMENSGISGKIHQSMGGVNNGKQ